MIWNEQFYTTYIIEIFNETKGKYVNPNRKVYKTKVTEYYLSATPLKVMH